MFNRVQNTEGVLDHTSVGGTLRRRLLAKERLVNAGTVIGLDEQLMEAPYKCTYVTASFVHLFFFDKTQVCLMVVAELVVVVAVVVAVVVVVVVVVVVGSNSSSCCL